MNRTDSISSPTAVRYRAPSQGDGKRVHALARACASLDVNSTYAYLLLCTQFTATSAVADADGEVVGFVVGFLEPSDDSVLFIWQIAVSPHARGGGVGRRLLQEVLDRPACRHVRHVETTITPSNEASWALFHSFARARRAECHISTLFRVEDFGSEYHEEERLLRIGPVRGRDDG